MAILDQYGRDTDMVWRIKATATFLHEPTIRQACKDTGVSPETQAVWMALLSDYLRPGTVPDGVEDRARGVMTGLLTNRIRRRVIAKHLQKTRSIGKAAAMEWLGRVASE